MTNGPSLQRGPQTAYLRDAVMTQLLGLYTANAIVGGYNWHVLSADHANGIVLGVGGSVPYTHLVTIKVTAQRIEQNGSLSETD